MIRNPQELLKGVVIPKVLEQKLDASKTLDLLLETWESEYVPLRLHAPVEVEEKSDTVSPVVSSNFGMDDLWGDDIGEGWKSSTSESKTTSNKVVKEAGEAVAINPHVTDQLSRSQLERMGFIGGGMVFTLLKHQLDLVDRSVEVGSTITFGGRKLRVVEMNEAVHWKHVDDNLYVVVNCEE